MECSQAPPSMGFPRQEYWNKGNAISFYRGSFQSRDQILVSSSAWAWCIGKTKDWVEREVGGGIGMGNTCKSMADSCQCMTKTTIIL